jgi:hypothetical protein
MAIMAEMILPGTYIEVRPEGLIVPTRVSVGTVGVVGTANKGPVSDPKLIGSFAEARQAFGEADAFIDGNSDELTLVRALEQAFSHGATTVIAVRVASNTAAKANFMLTSSSGNCCLLSAKSEGEWGNDIDVNVWNADENSFVSGEEHPGSGGTISLNYTPIVASARNRITVFENATQRTRLLQIIYTGSPTSGQVHVDTASGDLTFAVGEEPGSASDKVTASYVVNQSASVKVTVRLGTTEEVYTVASGNDLIADIKANSALIDAAVPNVNPHADELPDVFSAVDEYRLFGAGANIRGDNGAIGADYGDGLDTLLNEPAHIIVAAGQDHTDIGADLTSHCLVASSDANKRERIGVVGSGPDDNLDSILGHTLNSDRIIFVAPGINAIDAATGREVTLPGAYTAAAIAGLMAGYSPHISLTNKPLAVRGLEEKYTNAELTRLVQARVLAIQEKLGFRVVKSITSSTNTAWHQITTRRIVDYAKFGVRGAANPYIGLLNNERVRGALRATINSFLAEMVNDEMLVSYELDVTATRDDERQGIARVEMVLRPTFSIDFIKVTMYLE